MPGHIPTAGAITFSSLNETKNIKRATATTAANTTLGDLREWYYNYAGDINNTMPAANVDVKMSNFRDATVFGMQFYGRNETATTYHNAENVGFAFKNYPLPPVGDDSTVTFRLTGPAASKWNTTYSGTVAAAVDSSITISPDAAGDGVPSETGRQARFDSTSVDGAGGSRIYMEANIADVAEGASGNVIQLVGTDYTTATWTGNIDFVKVFGTYASVTTTFKSSYAKLTTTFRSSYPAVTTTFRSSYPALTTTFTASGTNGDVTSSSITLTDTQKGTSTHTISPKPDGTSTLNHMLTSPNFWNNRYTLTGDGTQIPVADTEFTLVPTGNNDYESTSITLTDTQQGTSTHTIDPKPDGTSTLAHMLTSTDFWNNRYTCVGDTNQVPLANTNFTLVPTGNNDYESTEVSFVDTQKPGVGHTITPKPDGTSTLAHMLTSTNFWNNRYTFTGDANQVPLANTNFTLTNSGQEDFDSSSITLTDTQKGAGNHDVPVVADGTSTLTHMLTSPNFWNSRYTLTGDGNQIPVAGTTFSLTGIVYEYETVELSFISDAPGTDPQPTTDENGDAIDGEGNGWESDTSLEETLDAWLGSYGIDLNIADEATANTYWARTVKPGQKVGPLAGGTDPFTVSQLITNWNTSNPTTPINTSNVIGGNIMPSPGATMNFFGGLDKGDIDPYASGSTAAVAFYGRQDGTGDPSWDGSKLSDSTEYTIETKHVTTGTAFTSKITMGYSTGAATVTGPYSNHQTATTAETFNVKWSGSTASPGQLDSWSDLLYMYIGKRDPNGRSYG